jgi:molybdate transport system regulatory protein
MLMRMVRLFVRIDFEPSGSAFGPGKAQLLERLLEYDSLRRAAASMGMSYRKAWLLVEEMQTAFNRAVVTAEVGGTGGGGMHLTALGSTLLKTYRRIEADVTEASQFELQGLAAMVQANAAPIRPAKRKRSPPVRLKNSRFPKKRSQSRSRPR